MAGRMPDALPQVRSPRVGGARMPQIDVSSGVQQLARAADQVAGDLEERRLRAQAEDDAVALSTALTQYRARQTERLLREGDELEDAQIEGFSDRFAAGLDEDADEVLGALPERVRGRAQIALTDTREDVRLRALGVEHERRVARQGRLLDDQLNAAGAVVFRDSTQYDSVLEQSRAAIEASSLPRAAQQEALSRLPRALAVQRMMGLIEAEPGLALRELNGTDWDGVLQVDDISRFRDAAQRELDRRRAEVERRAAAHRERLQVAVRTRMEDDLASIAATGRGVGLTLTEVERAYGADAAGAYATRRRQAEDTHTQLSRWRFMSVDEISRDVARAAPRAGQDGFAAAQERQQALAELAQSVIESRAADPVAASLLADPVLAQSVESVLTSADASARERRTVAAQLNDRQARLGVPASQRRLLTNTQAQAFANRVRLAAPAERGAVVGQVLDELGALYGERDAPRAVAEVARVAELPELGALAAVPHGADRQRLARALAAPEVEVTAAQQRDLTQRLDREFAPLRQSLASTPGGEERLAAARGAAERLARAEIAGGRGAGAAAEDAARTFTRAYAFRNGIRIPRAEGEQPLSADRVARGAQARLRALAREGNFQRPTTREGAPAAQARGNDRDSFLLNSRWVNTHDDLGVVLVDEWGDAVTDRDGRPITSTWRELEGFAAVSRDGALSGGRDVDDGGPRF